MADIRFDFIEQLSRAYKITFGELNAEGSPGYVLEDLARYCYANETTEGDQIKEGRRQVWLRIQEQLHLTPEQLAQLNDQRLAKRMTR